MDIGKEIEVLCKEIAERRERVRVLLRLRDVDPAIVAALMALMDVQEATL